MPEKLYNMLRGVSAANRGWLEGQLAVEEAQNQHEKALLTAQLDALKMQKDVAQTRLDYQVKVEGARQKRAELKSLDAHRQAQRSRERAQRKRDLAPTKSVLRRDAQGRVHRLTSRWVDGEWVLESSEQLDEQNEEGKEFKMVVKITKELLTKDSRWRQLGYTDEHIGQSVSATFIGRLGHDGQMVYSSPMSAKRIYNGAEEEALTTDSPKPGGKEPSWDATRNETWRGVWSGHIIVVEPKDVGDNELESGQQGMGSESEKVLLKRSIVPLTVEKFLKDLSVKGNKRQGRQYVEHSFMADVVALAEEPNFKDILVDGIHPDARVLRGPLELTGWKAQRRGIGIGADSLKPVFRWTGVKRGEPSTDSMTEKQLLLATAAAIMYDAEQVMVAASPETRALISGAKGGASAYIAGLINMTMGGGASAKSKDMMSRLVGMRKGSTEHNNFRELVTSKLINYVTEPLLGKVTDEVIDVLQAQSAWALIWTRVMTGQAVKATERLDEALAYFWQTGDTEAQMAAKDERRRAILGQVIVNAGGAAVFKRRIIRHEEENLMGMALTQRQRDKKKAERHLTYMAEQYTKFSDKDAETGQEPRLPWQAQLAELEATLVAVGYGKISRKVKVEMYKLLERWDMAWGGSENWLDPRYNHEGVVHDAVGDLNTVQEVGGDGNKGPDKSAGDANSSQVSN